MAHEQKMELEKLKLHQIQCENDTRIGLDEIKARSSIEVATLSQSSSSVGSTSLSFIVTGAKEEKCGEVTSGEM